MRDTPIQPIAHLTCVGNSTAEVVSTVHDYLESGVRTFLALRGDPPVGAGGLGTWPGRCRERDGAHSSHPHG